MFYDILFGYYDTAVCYVKSIINRALENTPERGLVEQNTFLVGEYLIFLVFGIVTFKDEPWLYNFDLTWDSTLTLPITIYYYLYISRYAVQLRMLEPTDKDYTMMTIHHASTIGLLGLSYWRFSRIGVIIAIVHDVADIFLLIAKICHKLYEVYGDKYLDILSTAHFILFTISFFVTRLLFNNHVLQYLYKHTHLLTYDYFEFVILFGLFHLNFVLQIIWQMMIFKFLYCLIRGIEPVDEKNEKYYKKE